MYRKPACCCINRAVSCNQLMVQHCHSCNQLAVSLTSHVILLIPSRCMLLLHTLHALSPARLNERCCCWAWREPQHKLQRPRQWQPLFLSCQPRQAVCELLNNLVNASQNKRSSVSCWALRWFQVGGSPTVLDAALLLAVLHEP
jgi:hypothetical protein